MKKISLVISSILITFSLFGFASDSLAVSGFTLDTIPKIVSPAPGATDVSLSPVLKWTAPWPSGETNDFVPAGEYEVWYQWAIDTSPISANGGSSLSFGSSGQDFNKMVKHPTTQLTLPENLAAGKTYYWAVRANRYKITNVMTHALTLFDYSEWSEGGQFATTGLTAPKIDSPIEGYQRFPPGSPIVWEPVAAAQAYGWQLLSNGAIVQSGLVKAKPSIQPSVTPQLQRSASYTFKVNARASCNLDAINTEDINSGNCLAQSAFSSVNFATNLPVGTLGSPSLISPAANQNVSAPFDLKWGKVEGATYYKWQIIEKTPEKNIALKSDSSSQLCSGSTDQFCSTISSALATDNLYPGTPYQWTAYACSRDAGSEKCSDAATPNDFFFLSATGGTQPPGGGQQPPGAPPVPTGLSPCGGQSGVSATPTLRWNSSTGVSVYYVDVSSLPEITTSNTSVIISADNFQDSRFVLTPGQQYSWYVKACDNTNKCSQSAPCTFTVGTPQGGGTPGGGTQGGQGLPVFGLNLCKDKKPCGPNEICNPLCAENIQDLIDVIINFIFWIAIIVAPIMIIIGAFYFITSAGDPGRLGTAKKIILYTVIGLVIVLFARGLIALIRSVVLGG